MEREKGKRGKMACKWLTDVEGSAYNRSAADGKKCNLVLQTQDMFPKLSAGVVMLTQFPVGFSNTCSSSEIETVISASLFLQEYNTELCWREGTSRERSCGSFGILGNGPLLSKPRNLDGNSIARSEES